MSNCIRGEEQEKECSEARAKVLKENGGKLPKKYKGTTLDSCLYCATFAADDDTW